MKQYIFISLFTFFLTCTTYAQSVIGQWYSIDPDTGLNESVIEIYKKGDKIYGKIIEILKEEDKDKTCIECTGKDKDQRIEGLVIVRGLSKDGDEWNDGKILDPKNGKLYKCYITLEEENKLKLRGYIGFSLIGRTEYWNRLQE